MIYSRFSFLALAAFPLPVVFAAFVDTTKKELMFKQRRNK